jgi:hypothetical protein
MFRVCFGTYDDLGIILVTDDFDAALDAAIAYNDNDFVGSLAFVIDSRGRVAYNPDVLG